MATKKKARKTASKKTTKKSSKKSAAPAVKIYSTPTCPWCDRTKQFLKEHNVKYQDVNVAADMKARQDMIRKTGQMGVPVIEIGKNIIIGYDEESLRELLKI